MAPDGPAESVQERQGGQAERKQGREQGAVHRSPGFARSLESGVQPAAVGQVYGVMRTWAASQHGVMQCTLQYKYEASEHCIASLLLLLLIYLCEQLVFSD
jgi:hypothetical protein